MRQSDPQDALTSATDVPSACASLTRILPAIPWQPARGCIVSLHWRPPVNSTEVRHARPASPSSKTRYLVKRLRAALPDVGIVVGRWAPSMLADDSTEPLRKAGADYVASTLVDTRNYLRGLISASSSDGHVVTPASPA
jgi:hypothetical protein